MSAMGQTILDMLVSSRRLRWIAVAIKGEAWVRAREEWLDQTGGGPFS
jgi:hypothetical protein